MKVTIARLRHFVALAEHGHFGRAAAALRISQPALTKSIRSLEAALGVRLFDRQSRGVVPTHYGEVMLAQTKDLLGRETELRREMQLLAGLETGHLDVWLGPYPSVVSGYGAAARLMGAHPKLQLALHVANWRVVTTAVGDKRAELGIAELADALRDERLATELVGQHRAHVFCRRGHPLLRERDITLATLLDYPWANTRAPPRMANAFPRKAMRAGRFDELTGDFVPAVEIDVPMQIARLVQGSDLLTFGAFSMVEADLQAGRVAYLPTPRIELRTHYGFIFRRHRSLSPAASAYMQAVREEERAFAEREASLEERYAKSAG